MVSVSCIIVTYNSGNILLDCLESISVGAGELSYEVIVIDNASSDNVIHQAKVRFPDIQLVQNTENRGFAGGNNQGLVIAKGQYLLLLNPDVILQPNSLVELVNYLKQNQLVGIVGPKTFDATGNISLTANATYSPLTVLWQYVGLDRLFPHIVYGKYRHLITTAEIPFEVNWVQGCCLLMRRQVYETIGGLDEGFFLFAEEPDYCERATLAGWKTIFVPSAEIKHFESTVVSRFPERRIRNYHISPLHYFRKRKQNIQVWMLKFGFTLELLIKMMVQLLKRTDLRRILIYWNVLCEIWQY